MSDTETVYTETDMIEAQSESHQTGFSEGYDDGKSVGFDEGYDEGKDEGANDGWSNYEEHLIDSIHEVHLKWKRKIQEAERSNMLASDREEMRLEIWTVFDDIRNGRLV